MRKFCSVEKNTTIPIPSRSKDHCWVIFSLEIVDSWEIVNWVSQIFFFEWRYCIWESCSDRLLSIPIFPLDYKWWNFAWHLLWLATTEGKNIVKLLAMSHSWQWIVCAKKGKWLEEKHSRRVLREQLFSKGKI